MVNNPPAIFPRPTNTNLATVLPFLTLTSSVCWAPSSLIWQPYQLFSNLTDIWQLFQILLRSHGLLFRRQAYGPQGKWRFISKYIPESRERNKVQKYTITCRMSFMWGSQRNVTEKVALKCWPYWVKFKADGRDRESWAEWRVKTLNGKEFGISRPEIEQHVQSSVDIWNKASNGLSNVQGRWILFSWEIETHW